MGASGSSNPSNRSIWSIRPTLHSPSSVDAMKPPPDLSQYVKPVEMHISARGDYGDVWMGRLQIGGVTSTVSIRLGLVDTQAFLIL